jgi:membrane protein YdbS with pleckstrin-like domain
MEPLAATDLVLDGTPRKLHPKARTLWMIRRSAIWIVLLLIALIASAAGGDLGAALTTIVAFGLCIACAAGSAVWSYRWWSWAAGDDAIEITHGIFFRHVSVVPYHRIQQIDIDRDPFERMLGIATLVLRSAAATTDAKVPGIGLDHSDAFRRVLLERSGSDDAV